jgi:putative transposase
MTRSRYHFLEDDAAPYFITTTTVGWLPLFANPEIAAQIINSLKYLISKGRINLIAYVIMENHVHLVASAKDISGEIAKFKSYTARCCIDYYLSTQRKSVLTLLSEHKQDHKSGRDFQFWQEGSHPQRIISDDMLQQKIDYIHQNPVKRGYVDLPEHWRYSSAKDYLGQPGLLPICLFYED